MAQNKVKVNYSGKMVDGTPVEIDTTLEQWNEYHLKDKSYIKLKAVVTEIVRIDGEYDKDGNPVYVVKSSQVAAISSPEELRKRE
ncbi:MAG: hypothetical protein ACYSRP_07295 [Planctomycetota bacterium]|jgi:hypothetical protein